MQAGIAAAQANLVHDLANTQPNGAQPEWFGHIVVGAAEHGLDGQLLRGQRADHDDARHLVAPAQFVEDFEAVHFGDDDVEQHQVRLNLLEHLHGLFAVDGFVNVMAVGLKQAPHQLQRCRLVID